jgi:hypothetical protein
MDWVKQRAQREKILNEAAPDLWSDLCSAIEEAVKSMKRFYDQGPTQAEFSRPHDNKVVVRLRRNQRSVECSFTFDPDTRQIIIGRGIAKNLNQITMDVHDGRVCFILNQERFTPDELSRRILEPLFFEKWDRLESG